MTLGEASIARFNIANLERHFYENLNQNTNSESQSTWMIEIPKGHMGRDNAGKE